MPRGRRIEGEAAKQGGLTEYRPLTGNPQVDNAVRILRDDIYKTRKKINGFQEALRPPGLSIDLTVESDEVFSEPTGDSGTLFLSEYTLGMTFMPVGNAGLAASGVAVANKVIAVLFMVPSTFTIHTVVFQVAALVLGSNVGVGWYDIDGNIVWQTGAVSSATATVKRITLTTPIEITQGMYWHAWTATSASVAVRGIAASGSSFFNVFNSGTVRFGSAAGGVGGVLPTILPALANPSAGEHPVFALMELE